MLRRGLDGELEAAAPAAAELESRSGHTLVSRALMETERVYQQADARAEQEGGADRSALETLENMYLMEVIAAAFELYKDRQTR
jgi:hypothetical protein